MPIRPRVLQFGVETAHQRLTDSLIGPQSGAKTAIGHVSGRSQPAWEMDRSCHERSTCERAPRCYGLCPRGHGAASAVEKHETRNHSQIWCFGTQHWDTRNRQLKSSARRTRCCKSRDLAQPRARQLLLDQTVADCLILHCFRCNICGVWGRAAGCRRATEGT